ncbi:hypothetical protein [Serratia entomophila]|uniref:hypothetical protein n=1 Tax=Serratia entomophila TaxID=42906 RepID=UPI0021B73ADB|nr:hypothetical protein [Serratia entomophila]
MNINDFKIVIARLLEDARRIQELEPNSGTQSRIEDAIKVLNSETVPTIIIDVVNIYPQ